MIITIPGAALCRGHTIDGEQCTIAGIGPIDLATARQYIPDAHLAYVIHHAHNVAVAHLGRQPTAHQRTALQARGYECAVPHCRTSHLLEIDHVRDWAISRQTRLDDLDWLCRSHHAQKTRDGYHLSGPPGHRTWHAPDGTPISQPPPSRPPAPTRPCSGADGAPSAAGGPRHQPAPADGDRPRPEPTPGPTPLTLNLEQPAARQGPATAQA